MPRTIRGTIPRRRRGAWRLGIGALVGVGALLALNVRRQRREERRRMRATGALPHVVILGGGLAGVFTAFGLKDVPVQVTVIDRVDHYLYQGMLYKVATGALSEADIAMPLRERLMEGAHAEFLLGEVDGIDIERREIHVRDRPHTLLYDHLVLATGMQPHYFGREQWARYALPLKTLADAVQLRDRILAAFEQAETTENPAHHRDLTTFVLVGGGPTGVEMAGALAEMVASMSRRDFRRFDPASTRIVVVEAMDRILPTFSAESATKARLRLTQLGVETMTGRAVADIDAEGVTLADGTRIPSRTVVWTAGVKATPVGAIANLPTDASGRVDVGPELTVAGHPEVHVAGDLAHCEEHGHVLPALAPFGLQTAEYVAKHIAREVEGGQPLPPFRYVDRGIVATVGRSFGVLEAAHGRLRVSGLPARLAWTGVHVLLQVPGVDKPARWARWGWGAVERRLGGRVMTGPDSRSEEESERRARETVTARTGEGKP